jgi:5-hydroxyisourate hydrolase
VEVADRDLQGTHGTEDNVALGANQPVPTISTHVLDTERGVPAAGVAVTLYRLADDGRPLRLTQALTDSDGRVRDLLERRLVAGDYRLEFDLVTPADGADATQQRFFRRVSLDLRVTDAARPHHVPLLVAAFSLTTYRGS